MKRLSRKTLYSLIIIIIAGLSFAAFQIYKTIKEPVVLEFGIFAGSNWDVPNWQSYKIFDEAIARFEKEHAGVKVKYRSGTRKADYSEWLAQKILKGEEPDIFAVLSGDFNTYASIGVMKNLDKLIKSDPDFDMDKLYKNAARSGQLQSSQYALPSEVVPVLMFVNKTLLKKEGIEVPKNDWTWNEFYDISRRVTKDTDRDGKIDQFGSYGFTWQHAVYTNGQKLFDANGTLAYFDNQEVLEAVKFITKLNKLNMNFKVTSEDFDTGKVAFMPLPFSSYRAYKPYPYRVKKFSQFEWEAIKLPRGPNGYNASELYSFLFGISSKTKNEKLAWEFIKSLTYDTGSQMNVFRYSHGVPVVRAVTESEEGRTELLKIQPG